MSYDWFIGSAICHDRFMRMGFCAKCGAWKWEWADRAQATSWPLAVTAANVIREFVPEARQREFVVRHRDNVFADRTGGKS